MKGEMRKDYSKIKVIGFDLDQTLYPKSSFIDEAIQIYIYHKISEHKGVSLTEAEKMFKDLYKEGRGLGGSTTLKMLGVPNHQDIVQEALERADIDDYLVPDQETLNILKRLKAKYQNIDILTGSNRTNANKKLGKLDMSHGLFGHILTNDDGSKPNGDLYKQWMALYPDLSPENFLYIGDRPRSDYEVPKSLGIDSILVYCKAQDANIDCPQLTSFKDIDSVL
ncbi:MAG: HAD hydrolase-like protein [Patescibacteria group bacterium]